MSYDPNQPQQSDRDSNLRMDNLNLHMDNPDNPSSLRTNNSNPRMVNLHLNMDNNHMDSLDSPNNHRTDNNGDSNLPRITLRPSM